MVIGYNMNKRIRLFFEFKVALLSYLIVAIIILGLYFFNITPKPLTTFNSQIGGIIIAVGFLLRTITITTLTVFDKHINTGIYALCRQPLLLSQFIVFTGLNIVVWNIFFLILSIVTFLTNDCLFAIKYDKILSHYYKNIWKTYTKTTNFIIPTLSRIKDVFIPPRLNTKKNNSNQNTLVFLSIYIILIEVATLSGL